MTKKLIGLVVSWLEWIAVAAFILTLLAAFIGGINANGFFGGVFALALMFLFDVLIFGMLFLIMQNNQLLKEIRDLLARK